MTKNPWQLVLFDEKGPVVSFFHPVVLSYSQSGLKLSHGFMVSIGIHLGIVLILMLLVLSFGGNPSPGAKTKIRDIEVSLVPNSSKIGKTVPANSAKAVIRQIQSSKPEVKTSSHPDRNVTPKKNSAEVKRPDSSDVPKFQQISSRQKPDQQVKQTASHVALSPVEQLMQQNQLENLRGKPKVSKTPVSGDEVASLPKGGQSYAGTNRRPNASTALQGNIDMNQQSSDDSWHRWFLRYRKKVHEQFLLREMDTQDEVIIQVTVSKTGRLLRATIMKGSDSIAYDTEVLKAIQRASPFDPLPDSGPFFRHEPGGGKSFTFTNIFWVEYQQASVPESLWQTPKR